LKIIETLIGATFEHVDHSNQLFGAKGTIEKSKYILHLLFEIHSTMLVCERDPTTI